MTPTSQALLVLYISCVRRLTAAVAHDFDASSSALRTDDGLLEALLCQISCYCEGCHVCSDQFSAGRISRRIEPLGRLTRGEA